ncbi:MAG: hypothetical protein SFU86_06045 [Pirellulaceae bacterium]|nr:hypothetical protein [Pirellulaceae bacterium]
MALIRADYRRWTLRVFGVGLVALALSRGLLAAEPSIFRCGDELLVRIENLDPLRQPRARLSASIRLAGEGGAKELLVDLADPLVAETIVIDLAGYGRCTGVLVEVTDGDGTVVHTRKVFPVAEVTMASDLALHADKFAASEPGTAMRRGVGSGPLIALPDAARIRSERIASPARVVALPQITYPVVTDSDLPIPASENYVLVSRSSFAPADANQCSLYFSYRKPIYDAASTRLASWRKFLVEVPLSREWLAREGDEVITLPLSGFAVHATEELAPRGTNMLGASQNGIAQGGQSADTDDHGRIYFSNLSDGAGLVRFNPHTGRLEQPPVNFSAEIRRLIPAVKDWNRSWDTDLGELLCLRGRVYILFARNYRVHTSNGNFETCSGVISLPQENWNNAAAFQADIRLHAGSWEGAKHRLYDSDVPLAEYSRKLLAPIATRHGLSFVAAGASAAMWRLDLDDNGNTARLAEVKALAGTTTTQGDPIPPTELLTTGGLRKQRLINVGSAGRQFVRATYGEFEISRAALALTMPDAPLANLTDAERRHRSTFPGAPSGTLTIRFDIAGQIKSDRVQFGTLAGAMSGISQGPNYCVTAIPGEPDRAIGVCEYGYYFSKLDFSRRTTEGKVFKEYLPQLSAGEPTTLPARVGLGPYNSAWVRHDGALWLYMTGYTGMSRLKYRPDQGTQGAFAADMFYRRLNPRPIDGQPRDSIKDYLHLIPATDGRLIDIARGRPGRGGGAFSAGLELFDPRTLGESQTAVFMSRCYGLHTPVSRLVFSAAGNPPRQELYVASSPIRPEYVSDLSDAALIPSNQEPKVFVYDCLAGGGLRDMYGFSVPPLPGGDSSCDLALSPCGQYLVLLQQNGDCYSYSLARQKFVDALHLQLSGGEAVRPISFDRPSAYLWTAPTGQLFFLAAGHDLQAGLTFTEITVQPTGRLAARPHLAIAAAVAKDIAGSVRCFLPDLSRRDGSYDFVLGGDQENGQPTVRVIDDFVPPRTAARP